MTSPDSPSPAIVALVRNGAARDQERAAGALGNLARNDTNRVAIAEALVVAANGNNYEQIVRAMKTFANDDSSNRAALAKALVMAAAVNSRSPQLAARTVERFTRGDADNRFAFAKALAREGDQAWMARAMHSLTYGHAANRATIAAGLVALMASKRDQNRAARAMETFSRGKADNCGAIAEADGIAALVQHVASGKAETATLAVLRRLACDAVGIGTRYFLRVSTQLRGHTYVHADILAYIKPKNRATIVDALVALVASGAAGGQERAAAALAVLACDVPNQTAIAAAGGVVALVALVTHGAAAGREAAARALGALAQAAANRSAIADAGGIDPLVALVRNGAAGGQEAAAAALAWLAYDDAANQAAIAAAGGIPPLVALVTNDAARGQKWAAAALANLACDVPNQTAIAAAGGIAPLVALVTNGAADGREKAAGALANLACNRRVPRVSPVLPRTNYRQAWEQRENSQMPKPGIYDHCRNDVGDIMERIGPVIQAYYKDKVVTYQGKTNPKKLYLGIVNASKRL